MKILLVETYYSGSHKAWCDGLIRFSSHDIRLLKMKGQFWKWRMHNGAVTMANWFLESGWSPDLILVTDMINLPLFHSLTRRVTASVPTAIYFHENQISYPWSPRDRDISAGRDKHYGFINFVSALTADHVIFNSRFHKENFLDELGRFLKHFPDHNEFDSLEQIRAKGTVLFPGVDLLQFDQYNRPRANGPARILWNHRLEHDKNPDEFFRVLLELQEEGFDFEVIVLGEQLGKPGEHLEQAIGKLGNRIIQFGYVKDFREYATWLWSADILPVTSYHDFFGMSVIEAIYCDTYPLLPLRLVYPEHFSSRTEPDIFYEDYDSLKQKLRDLVKSIDDVRNRSFRDRISRYDWRTMIDLYDETFSRFAEANVLHG